MALSLDVLVLEKNAMNYDPFLEEKTQCNLLQSVPAQVQHHQDVDYLIPRKTVEKMSGLSRATIYRLIKSGKFPRPLSIGTGSVRWRQSDIIAWQHSLRPSS